MIVEQFRGAGWPQPLKASAENPHNSVEQERGNTATTNLRVVIRPFIVTKLLLM